MKLNAGEYGPFDDEPLIGVSMIFDANPFDSAPKVPELPLVELLRRASVRRQHALHDFAEAAEAYDEALERLNTRKAELLAAHREESDLRYRSQKEMKR